MLKQLLNDKIILIIGTLGKFGCLFEIITFKIKTN